jgi:hypothetical protein
MKFAWHRSLELRGRVWLNSLALTSAEVIEERLGHCHNTRPPGYQAQRHSIDTERALQFYHFMAISTGGTSPTPS